LVRIQPRPISPTSAARRCGRLPVVRRAPFLVLHATRGFALSEPEALPRSMLLCQTPNESTFLVAMVLQLVLQPTSPAPIGHYLVSHQPERASRTRGAYFAGIVLAKTFVHVRRLPDVVVTIGLARRQVHVAATGFTDSQLSEPEAWIPGRGVKGQKSKALRSPQRTTKPEDVLLRKAAGVAELALRRAASARSAPPTAAAQNRDRAGRRARRV